MRSRSGTELSCRAAVADARERSLKSRRMPVRRAISSWAISSWRYARSSGEIWSLAILVGLFARIGKP